MFLSRAKNMSAEKNESPQKIRAIIYVYYQTIAIIIVLLRIIHLTESRWQYEYDRNRWTWPKNSHRQTLTIELDWKYNKYKAS